MNCPYCKSTKIRVMDSRHIEEENAIKRRRECEDCKKRFSTLEMVQEASIMVVKKDGRHDLFDKEKILRGLVRSCQKRPVSNKQMQDIANDIEKQILNSMDRQVSSTQIGEMDMAKLRDLDEVSYIRFASVYREFKDVDSFFDELNLILQSKRND